MRLKAMTDSDAFDGWERHRREQIRDIARRTTPAQRLAWVEEMIELARRVGARSREDILREAEDRRVP